jgi:hypothetical protein
MNYIKDINSFIMEAISMKMYKENLPKKYWYSKSEGYKKWDKLFGKGVNRISIPLNKSKIDIPTSTPLMEEINELFIPLGYKINSFEDYLNNKVYKIGDTKNPMKIGGLLNKSNPSLFKKFDVDTERKKWKDKINNSDKDLKIIISRHPYDLLGMTSGRDWRNGSCMKLGAKDDKVYLDILASMGDKSNENEKSGKWKNKIKQDIKEGVLVAYVVKFSDDNINNPISRVLIKPYVNDSDESEIIWVSSDMIYGQEVDGFKETVDSWIDSWQEYILAGTYCIKDNIYADRKYAININKPMSDWTQEDKNTFLDWYMPNLWSLNSNGEIDVDGDVNLYKQGFSELPVKFGKVEGNFRVGFNNLTSLKNCPSYVGGYFDVEVNQISSLEGFPEYVGDDVYIGWNKLKNLNGLPKKINGTLSCSANMLKSLEGFPEYVQDSILCKGQIGGYKFKKSEILKVCKVNDNSIISV